jgi:hypothetical protein
MSWVHSILHLMLWELQVVYYIVCYLGIGQSCTRNKYCWLDGWRLILFRSNLLVLMLLLESDCLWLNGLEVSSWTATTYCWHICRFLLDRHLLMELLVRYCCCGWIYIKRWTLAIELLFFSKRLLNSSHSTVWSSFQHHLRHMLELSHITHVHLML